MHYYTLSRFVNIKERDEIILRLKKQGIDAKIDLFNKKMLITSKKLLNKPYIASSYNLLDTISPNTLTEFASKLSEYKISEIKAKVGKGVPFHEKAIIDRFKKQSSFDNKGKKIFIDAYFNGKLYVRIFENLTSNVREIKYPDLAIESPKTIGEISDFVRMGKVFSSKVYIITLKDPKCLKAIEKFKDTNSFDKADIEIIGNANQLFKNYNVVSFSLWGKHTLKDLKDKKDLLLIFGNEDRGLKESTMRKSSITIKIGNRSSEPLRATQAASFAFGYLFK